MKKRTEGGVIWEPETLKEYYELAEADFQLDEIVEDMSVLYQIDWYANSVLGAAVFLIKHFRLPKLEISETEYGDFETNKGDVFWKVEHSWVLKCCRLWLYVSKVMGSSRGYDFCVKYWPRRPKVEGFGEIGMNALQVIEFFSVSVGNIFFDALKSACQRDEYEDLIYDFIACENVILEPTFESKAVNWFKEAKRNLEKRFPSSQWPDSTIEQEEKSLACQLQYEAEEAEKVQKEEDKKENFNKILLQDSLLAALTSLSCFMGVTELANIYKVDTEALRKRLERYRNKHPLDTDFFIESQDRGTRKPKFLYNAKLVAPIAKILKKRKTSDKRPTAKK